MSSIQKIKQEVKLLKKKFDALKPLDPMYEKNIESRLSMKLTYNSNAIEGNTLSEMETKMVVDKSLKIYIDDMK